MVELCVRSSDVPMLRMKAGWTFPFKLFYKNTLQWLLEQFSNPDYKDNFILWPKIMELAGKR